MKSLIKKIVYVCLGFALTLSFVGCERNSIDDKLIIVAASESPHSEILEEVRGYIEAQGYELEVKVFSDYVIPNEVTKNGEVDANFFQHLPHLEDYNLNNKASLVSVLQVHFEPLGLYLGKMSSLDNLKNAKIAIANDTSNGARGLLLLQDQGIIKLDPAKGTNVTVTDIIENNHSVEIIELEAAIIPAQLIDLDFAVINGNYALAAKIDQSKKVASEDKDSDAALLYSNIIAVKEENKDKDAIKVLIEALKQASISKFIEETYDGVVVPIN